jgi:Xaa-Pro aminopeptidase
MGGPLQHEVIEGRAPTFSVERFLAARERTLAAVAAIAEAVEVGMAEDEANDLARRMLAEAGLRRGWHRTVVRFGVNTTLNFHQRSAPGVVLQPDDVFFLDIGPVHDGYEGDAGATFAVGADPEMQRIADDVVAVFEATRDRWREGAETGRQLYRTAAREAEDRGWVLNLDLTGHRLSEFPHRVHFPGNLDEIDFVPGPLLWVLEIQLRHPTRPFGAFYEDLLGV